MRSITLSSLDFRKNYASEVIEIFKNSYLSASAELSVLPAIYPHFSKQLLPSLYKLRHQIEMFSFTFNQIHKLSCLHPSFHFFPYNYRINVHSLSRTHLSTHVVNANSYLSFRDLFSLVIPSYA